MENGFKTEEGFRDFLIKMSGVFDRIDAAWREFGELAEKCQSPALVCVLLQIAATERAKIKGLQLSAKNWPGDADEVKILRSVFGG